MSNITGSKNDMRFILILLFLGFVLGGGGAAEAGKDKGQPNQADINHPDIHDKVGGGQSGDRRNANPNDANERGGGLHGIGNNPGQGGDHPNADGTNGQANELDDMHGGIGDVNQNVD